MAKKATRQQYRQGDVYVTPVDTVPGDAVAVEVEGGLCILARGEATGHHHSVPGADAAILAKGAERYLRVRTPTRLRHQEHDEIRLPAGDYVITIQVEYDPTVVARAVVD